MNLTIVCLFVFIIAITMSMTGRGGGNFYVLILVIAGQAMHQAATSAQFILMLSAFTAMLVFKKKGMVDWKLALIIDPPTDIMAFIGGYYSGYASNVALKFTLSGFLVLAAFLMLIKIKERPIDKAEKLGYWHRTFQGQQYVVNLWLAIPVTALAGFAAGAVGISGGSFKVPLMVLLCGIPMKIAVGTSSAMVAATALMGFAGHTLQGHFEPGWAIPLAITAIIGGFIGGKFAIKTDPKKLKKIFALTTLAAALFMAANAILAK